MQYVRANANRLCSKVSCISLCNVSPEYFALKNDSRPGTQIYNISFPAVGTTYLSIIS
jgi:hypothetical protein